jgi:hypothetical protein
MKKGIFIGIIFLVFFITTLVTNTVFAITGSFTAYTVGKENSTDPVPIFDWDETPWLYISLPYSGLNVVASWWESPSNNFYFVGSGPSYDQEIWLSLDSGFDSSGNPITWFDVREVDVWNITVGYFYSDGKMDSTSVNFTVTPEPLSSILFVAGGATLAARFYWRRRIKGGSDA